MTIHEAFPHDLLRGLQQGRAVLFVGPGLSRAAGSTTMDTLHTGLRNALRHSIPLSDAAELEVFLERASPQEVAQAVHDHMGSDAFLELLQQNLEVRNTPPSPVLYALRALPFRVIVTTNFDRMLERTYENPLDDSIQLEVVLPQPDSDAPIPDPTHHPVLVKLFGDMMEPSSLILKTDDYEAYFRMRPKLVKRLKTLLAIGPALFIGYHIHDYEFRRLYSMTGALLARAHKRAYAIMDRINKFEATWWSQRALTPLGSPNRSLEHTLRELYRHYQRQAHPIIGLDEDIEHNEHSRPKSRLAPLLRKQIEALSDSWLMLDHAFTSDLNTSYVPSTLRAEYLPQEQREQRMEELLSGDSPDAVQLLGAHLTVDAGAVLERTKRSVVLGPIGAGKTTLLLHLLLQYTDRALEEGDPILVAYLPFKALADSSDLSVMECVVEHLHALDDETSREELESTVMDALVEGEALLLLDGLDEIDPEAEPGVLERLATLVSDCPDVRMVITCRTGAFDPKNLPADIEVSLFELQGFDEEQQLSFIRNRFQEVPKQGESLIALLHATIAPWAERLATNPLHLSLICGEYRETNHFPTSRPQLYAAYISALLKQSKPGDENHLYAFDKELILQVIALYSMMHPDEPLTEELLLDLVGREMSRAIIAPRKDINKRVDARVALSEIVDHSRVLVASGAKKTFEFRHQAIQEYLVAKRVFGFWSDEAENITAFLSQRRWAGVFRLTAALHDDATDFLDRLETAGFENRRLAARCFGEAQRVRPEWMAARLGEKQGATPEFGRWLARLHDKLSPQETLDLFGEILWRDQESYLHEGHRTDGRSVFIALSGLRQMVEAEGAMAHQAAETIASWRGAGEPSPDNPWPCTMVTVPGGPVLTGSAAQGSTRFVNCSGFEIGLTPITFGQYQVFNPSHDLSDVPKVKRFLGPNQPVVNISWFDAWVCAAWYGCFLPSTLQWEKAAAWDSEKQERRIYPWGDGWALDNSNTAHTWKGLGRTTPIDRYGPLGRSAFGCSDMAGNVFEWLQDRAAGYPERRVLKGGNWQSTGYWTKVAASIQLKPNYRGMGVGFRLCR